MLSKIDLISPSKKEFSGKWIGNPFTVTKKIGIFEYPGVNGAKTQDLGIASSQTEIEFYFDGTDHLKRAIDLQNALEEKGPWNVWHPTRGILFLQPTAFTVEDNPVTNSSSTKITTSWIKYTPNFTAIETSETIFAITRKAQETTKAIRQPIPETTENKKTSWAKRFASRVDSTVAVIDKTYAQFWAINGNIRNQIGKYLTMIDRLTTQPIIAARTTIDLLHTIIAIPATIDTTVKSKVALYEKLTDAMANDIQTIVDSNTAEQPDATVYEMTAVAIVASCCSAITTGEPTRSRDESFYIIQQIVGMYYKILSMLDTLKMAVSDIPPENAYFPLIVGYDQFCDLIGQTINYIGSEAYSPTIKKRVIIGSETPTLLFALTSYPDLPAESCLDYLIQTNNLSGSKLITLQPGDPIDIFIRQS